jgi:hypothetical protein
MRVAVCTICSNNYIAFAKNLLQSLKGVNDSADRFLLVVDEMDRSIIGDIEPARAVSLRELGISPIREMAFKYGIVEFNTSVKPFLFRWILDQGYDAVVYLDPDIMVFCPLDAIYGNFRYNSILLTPHILSDTEGGILAINAFSCNGVFNLGFFGVKGDDEGRRVLDWWGRKLVDHCYLDYPRGLATDQKWADFFPAVFSGVGILRHEGCNMAFWNLHERALTIVEDRYLVNSRDPLLFYHFSGYKLEKPDWIHAGAGVRLDSRPDLEKIYEAYRVGVSTGQAIGVDYLFSRFMDGTPIRTEHRIMYGAISQAFGDPFSIGPGSFHEWLSKRRLIGRKPEKKVGRSEALDEALGRWQGEKAGASRAVNLGPRRRLAGVALLVISRLLRMKAFFRLLAAFNALGDLRILARIIR